MSSVPDAAASVYRSIFESMTCGVMLIDGDGQIETFNPAAAAILGMEQEAALHRSFAEVFIGNADYEQLSEAVLAAIYDGAVGLHRVATVSVGERAVPLAVDTSYLQEPGGRREAHRSVVAVFSDISELESLRVKEAALARDLAAKHQELRAAYRGLEGRNRELGDLLRKVRAVRVAAVACGALLACGIGAWLWSESPAIRFGSTPTQAARTTGGERVVVVEPVRVASTITVPSTIEPLREVAITSPIEAQVGAVHAAVGAHVVAGQPLLDLDVSEVRIERRKAETAYLKAKAQVDLLADWANSSEASRAKRALTKSQIALEAANTKLEEVSFLVEEGLAPAARKVAAERELRTRLLDLEAAEQDLHAVLAKGGEDRAVSDLELETARGELERLDAILRNATVVAPVAGVVLRLGGGAGQRGSALSAGTSIDAGQHLVTIGDMAGVTVSGRVDEVEVRRLAPGAAVRISGPAFPGVRLEGRVTYISSQAYRVGGQTGVPAFEIVAAVDRLASEERAAVRLGMSAELEIVVYESDTALVVPIGAVDLSTGNPQVRVRDQAAGAERIVRVATGVTTLDGVEILSGLAPGDRVVVP